ncbi:MAG: DciA family protein [Patescibacteria group bacterium]
MFQSLKSILPSRLLDHGVLKQAIIAQMVEEFNSYLSKRWGNSALDIVRNVFFKDDTLHIQVSSSVLGQEIKLSEKEILKILETRFPGKVKRLRIFG